MPWARGHLSRVSPRLLRSWRPGSGRRRGRSIIQGHLSRGQPPGVLRTWLMSARRVPKGAPQHPIQSRCFSPRTPPEVLGSKPLSGERAGRGCREPGARGSARESRFHAGQSEGPETISSPRPCRARGLDRAGGGVKAWIRGHRELCNSRRGGDGMQQRDLLGLPHRGRQLWCRRVCVDPGEAATTPVLLGPHEGS